jgi:anti-anti-sigma regulatory factor
LPSRLSARRSYDRYDGTAWEANQRLLQRTEELAQAKRHLEIELGERARAEQARAELREELIRVGVQASRAQVVVLDVTRMRELGADIASTLVGTASALRLLGAEAVLTGVRPDVAKMLIATQADLRGIVTCGTLKCGIAYAMGRTNERRLARPSWP